MKHGIPAPTSGGPDEFLRVFRVHQNSVEQLVLFVPALWMFAFYVHELAAAGIGLLYIVTRVVYRISYISEPKSRGRGFAPGALLLAVLIIGSMIGAAIRLYQGG